MKIYFTASLRGKSNYESNYNLIVSELTKVGARVYCEHIMESNAKEVGSQSSDQAKNVYKKLIKEIKRSDVFVAEVSTQSLSVGHEITEAINMNKPVILLYTGGINNRPGLLFGADYQKLQIIEYTVDNLSEKVVSFIEEAKKNTDVRFNFFVSPKILAYLDWVAKTKKLPRAVFLRELIEKEMRKDKEFRE